MSTNPRYLNLDEMPTVASEVAIKHLGVEHFMEVLTVDAFVEQQKRAEEHEALVSKAVEQSLRDDVTTEEAQATELQAITVIRDAIKSFFPTLPVGEMPVPKMFMIFKWLNDMSNAANLEGAEGATDAEGNV